MAVVRALNLGLRFFLELAALVALGYWGFTTRESTVQKILFGIGAPLVAAVIWGLFVAPKAIRLIRLPWRLLIEAIVFGGATLALVFAGQPTLGWIFLAVVVVNEVLLLVSSAGRQDQP